MLKDEIQFSNDQNSLEIQLNSFEPKIMWRKNDNSDIISFELSMNKKKSIFKFAPHIGRLLKEFLNGKVCFTGINNHYKIAQFIQKRDYGSIVRMRNIQNEELVTCKIIKQGRAEVEQVFRNEVVALQFLQHKNIPKLREYYIETHHNYIIYEFIEGASLDNYIKKNILNKHQIYKIMKDLLSVVEYLHKEGFSHQNIKLENVYYCSMLDQITLIDFGQQKTNNINTLRQVQSMNSLSTKDYIDLNSFTCREYSMEKDYCDIGIIFYQLITQKILINQDLLHLDESKKFYQLTNEIHNQNFSQFIMKLFNYSNISGQGKLNLVQELDELILQESDIENI